MAACSTFRALVRYFVSLTHPNRTDPVLNRQMLAGIAFALLLAFTAVVVGLWLVDRLSGPGDTGADGDARVLADDPPDGAPSDVEAAIVDRVVDGDTLRVIAAPGGSIPEGGSIRVRLLNIDTPELARDGRPAECAASEATQRLEEMVAPGDLVWLAADREDRDRFGRPLRGLWTADGTFVNEVLAADGFAEALLIEPNDRFHAQIERAVEQARGAGIGIWGELCPS